MTTSASKNTNNDIVRRLFEEEKELEHQLHDMGFDDNGHLLGGIDETEAAPQRNKAGKSFLSKSMFLSDDDMESIGSMEAELREMQEAFEHHAGDKDLNGLEEELEHIVLHQQQEDQQPDENNVNGEDAKEEEEEEEGQAKNTQADETNEESNKRINANE